LSDLARVGAAAHGAILRIVEFVVFFFEIHFPPVVAVFAGIADRDLAFAANRFFIFVVEFFFWFSSSSSSSDAR
jgi:hypothetical protein